MIALTNKQLEELSLYQTSWSKQLKEEWSTLIGPEPSRHCALIGWDHRVADISSLMP